MTTARTTVTLQATLQREPRCQECQEHGPWRARPGDSSRDGGNGPLVADALRGHSASTDVTRGTRVETAWRAMRCSISLTVVQQSTRIDTWYFSAAPYIEMEGSHVPRGSS